MKNEVNFEKHIEDKFFDLPYGRYLLLNSFYKSIVDFKLPKKINIAVLGGARNQYEIVLLNLMGFETEVTVFGIEDEDVFFDLN